MRDIKFYTTSVIKMMVEYSGGSIMDNPNDLLKVDLLFLGRHKLISIWYHMIQKYELRKLLGKHNVIMIEAYLSRLKKYSEIRNNELLSFTNVLNESGISYALRKGESIKEYYIDPSHRVSNDYDILVNKNSMSEILEILEITGYVEGYYSERQAKIIKHSRGELLAYMLSPDHSPHLTKVVDGVPVTFDFAFTLAWNKHESAQKYVLNNLNISRNKQDVNVLKGDSLYLDTVLHLYRESRFVNDLKGRAPYLVNYLDVMLMKDFPKLKTKESKCINEDISTLKSFKDGTILDKNIILEGGKYKDTMFPINKYIFEVNGTSFDGYIS
ncbi:nucleotidyltransferase family protein [Vibrio splendidus]